MKFGAFPIPEVTSNDVRERAALMDVDRAGFSVTIRRKGGCPAITGKTHAAKIVVRRNRNAGLFNF
jgi:hypothetical protein